MKDKQTKEIKMENKNSKWNKEYETYLKVRQRIRQDPATLLVDFGGIFLLISGIALMVYGSVAFPHMNVNLAATGAAVAMAGYILHYIGVK